VVGAQAVRGVKNILYAAGIILQTQEHIHQHRLVAPAAQGAADTSAAGQRHIALGTQTSG